MSEARAPGPAEGRRPEPGSLAAFLAFVWRHRRLVFGLTGLVTLATVVVVLVLPVRYTARAVLLPQSEEGPGLMSVVGSLVGGGLGALGGLDALAPETALQEAVLRSERLADEMNAEFDLAERFGASNREEFLRAWQAALGTETNQQGLLTVSFTDEDPEFAAAVTARLIELLDAFNRESRSSVGRRTREFVEERIRVVRARMTALEDSLVAFQAGNRAIAVSPTTESVIAAGAEVLIRKIQLEMELEVLRESLSPDAPAVRMKRAEAQALERELARLPELNSELARLLRDLRVVEGTYGFLATQLEEARIEEARDTRTVDVLDPPRVPQEKSWPQRKVAVLVAAALSGLLSLGLATLLDASREARAAAGTEGG